jgi:hypothetical protein
MSKNHIQGVKKMVEIKGGPQTLGLNGLLAGLFYKIENEETLLDILHQVSDPCRRVALQFSIRRK